MTLFGNPEDFVVSSDLQFSVRDFLETAAKVIDLSISWSGNGLNEIGVDQNGRTIVNVKREYFRPSDVDALIGDSTRARKKLQWEPKISFQSLVQEMMNSDLHFTRNGMIPDPFE